MKKETLDEIGLRYMTDKSSALHGYLEHYEKLFPEPEKIKKVVEIGLQRRTGTWKNSHLPSVNMWLEFFPSAHVFGFDKQNLKIDNERVTLFEGDQGRIYHHMQAAEPIGWDIDFVLEDCSHRASHQLLSFLFFFPRLKNGGIYICEDTRAVVQNEYDKKYWPENYFIPYLERLDCEWHWVPSKTGIEKSSLVIIKK